MEILPFEIAQKLKEKGFPQRPNYFNYSSYYNWDGLRKIHSLSNASVWFDTNISRDNIYFAPTISQVLKWLREEKKFHIAITLYQDDREQFNGWGCTIINFNLKNFRYIYYDICRFKNEWVSYESAALAGIKYVINKLI